MRLPATVFLAAATTAPFMALAASATPAMLSDMPACNAATACLTPVVERKKIPNKAPSGLRGPKTIKPVQLTAQECERLGGAVTGNGDPNCKTNTRCKMTLPNGDLRSVCIDEAK
ncbi:hypothetical protein BL864_005550 [Escherichia coli]|nr:hypothetical protein [Escherichia coli]